MIMLPVSEHSLKLSLILGCTCILFNSGCQLPYRSKAPETSSLIPEQNLAAVHRSNLTRRVSISGNVSPNRKSIISAPYSGYVSNIHVHTGQEVRSGDPIVTMTQSLGENPTQVFPLRAPFAGTVVQILKKEGEFCDPQNNSNSTALVRIDDLTVLFVESTVPEMEFPILTSGMEAIVRATALQGKEYQGKIQDIGQSSLEQKDWDKSRVEFPISLRILNPDSKLKAGMSVTAEIKIMELKQVLTLDLDFVRKSGKHYFIVTPNGTEKEIQIGARNEEVFQIISGLNEGDQVRRVNY